MLGRAALAAPGLKVDRQAYRVARALLARVGPKRHVLAPLRVSQLLPMLNGYSYPLMTKPRFVPVSLGAPSCVFRPVAIEALGKARRDWRAVCEVSRMEPVHAVLEAGLAVAPLLRSSVPERFEILGREARLPALPEFRINLYAPPSLSPAARDLADHVRASFSGRAP